MRGGNWKRKDFEGVELYNKTLGVIGMGRIGSELSRRAIAFGMRVLAYDPYLSPSRARSLQVELVDELDDLLASADFISLHTPLTDETRNLLGAREIGLLPKGARVLNCARGGIINEAALVEALRSGQLAGAALDVFTQEPPPADHPLLGLPNVVVTPHLGASTVEAQVSVAREAAQLLSIICCAVSSSLRSTWRPSTGRSSRSCGSMSIWPAAWVFCTPRCARGQFAGRNSAIAARSPGAVPG